MCRMIVLGVVISCAAALAQTTRPATNPAVPADVQALLDHVRAAYASANALEMSGTIAFEFQAGEETKNPSVAFTSKAGGCRMPAGNTISLRNGL